MEIPLSGKMVVILIQDPELELMLSLTGCSGEYIFSKRIYWDFLFIFYIYISLCVEW